MAIAARLLARLEKLICFSALAALLIAVLWGVMTRYITERPAVWTTELSGILFTWVVFIGATTAFRDDRHIRVTLLVDALPTGVATVIRAVAQVIVLGFLSSLAYLSYEMMMQGATRLSPVMRIPFSFVYLSTFLAFTVMAATAALRLFAGARMTSTAKQDGAL